MPEPHDDCCAPAPLISRRSIVKGAAAGAALMAVPNVISLPSAGARAKTVAASKRAAAPTAPAIVPRRQWGANESIRGGGAKYESTVEKVIVHHTGTTNGITDWAGQVRQIYQYEIANGYNDIAYHFLVDPNGVVYEGRWARDLAPGESPDGANAAGQLVRGGHAMNHNQRTVGIALIGDYTKVSVPPAMLAAVVDLVAWLCARFRIDPLASGRYTTGTGAVAQLPNIAPHGATTQTECPGTAVLQALPTIRGAVADRIGNRPTAADGYWIAGSEGRRLGFGAASAIVADGTGPAAALTAIEADPSGRGYWAVARDGGVFAYGDAPFHGSLGGTPLRADVVGVAPTADGKGYWLASADGGVFAFGDAKFRGGLAGKPLRAPIVDICRSPRGHGYWLLGADGGVFAFGDAPFHGGLAGNSLRAPAVAMAASDDGYWIVGRDGGVFAFGDATYLGNAADGGTLAPVTAMTATPTRRGYLLLTADGAVFAFGDAHYRGGAQGLTREAIGIAGPVAS